MIDLPDKLWDLANGITAFAVAQALFLAYLLARDEFRTHAANQRTRQIILFGSIAAALLYAGAVFGCWKLVEDYLTTHKDIRVWKLVTFGRSLTIGLFTVGVGLAAQLALRDKEQADLTDGSRTELGVKKQRAEQGEEPDAGNG